MQRGKTTVAKYLVKEHGFVKYSLGAKLKSMVKDLRPDLFENNNKPRIYLQEVGTSMRKILGYNIWTDYILNQMKYNICNIVIDDIRYQVEAKVFERNDFIIIKVTGPNRSQNITEGENHESETSVETIIPDYVISNKFTIEMLYKNIDYMLNLRNWIAGHELQR